MKTKPNGTWEEFQALNDGVEGMNAKSYNIELPSNGSLFMKGIKLINVNLWFAWQHVLQNKFLCSSMIFLIAYQIYSSFALPLMKNRFVSCFRQNIYKRIFNFRHKPVLW